MNADITIDKTAKLNTFFIPSLLKVPPDIRLPDAAVYAKPNNTCARILTASNVPELTF